MIDHIVIQDHVTSLLPLSLPQHSSQDANLRMPVLDQPILNSLRPPPLLPTPTPLLPTPTPHGYTQEALSQLIALNSSIMGQGNGYTINPFLPFPMGPVGVAPVPPGKPNKNVRPPPGFDTLSSPDPAAISSDPVVPEKKLPYIKK